MIKTEQNLNLLAGTLDHAMLDQVNSFIARNEYKSMLHGQRIDLKNGLSAIYLEVSHDPLMLTILEAHRKFIDLHYVLEGEDVIALRPLQQCTSVYREYDSNGDYVLFKEKPSQKVLLKAGSYCYIPNTTAHMALHEGSSTVVKKVVFKIPA